MRVALLQVAFDDDEPLDGRRERVAALVRRYGAEADLVVLPELWWVGAFAARTWAERAEALDGSTRSAMASAARDAGCVLHAGSIIERADDGTIGPDGGVGLYNTSLILDAEGALLTTYRKIHTFGAAGLEAELLAAGVDPVTCDLPGREPLRVGLATCYDLRFPELFRLLTRRGAQALIVPAAWPLERAATWTLLLRARAIENQAYVLGCGAAGVNGKTQMAGASVVVGPTGDVLTQVGADEQVLTCEIHASEVERARAAFPVLADRRLSTC